jgi:beta-galactosidase
VHPEAVNALTFEVSGAGRMIGVDNGNMADVTADFKGRSVTAFHGMCLAIVQSAAKAGEIHVAASSAGLRPATVTVLTKPG